MDQTSQFKEAPILVSLKSLRACMTEYGYIIIDLKLR